MRYSCSNPICSQQSIDSPSADEKSVLCPSCASIMHRGAQPAVDRWVRVLMRWLASDRIGWSVLIAVSLVLLALRLWNMVVYPANMLAMLREITAVGEFRKAPVSDHAGRLLLYARNNDTGVGLYLLDVKSSTTRELDAIDVPDDSFNLFGWSPDDRLMLHTMLVSSEKVHQLIIRDGATGRLIRSLGFDGSPQSTCWLDNDNFAVLDSEGRIYAVSFIEGRSAPVVKLLKKPNAGESKSGVLIAFDDQRIAFSSAGEIWTVDIRTSESKPVVSFPNTNFEWLNYNRATREFLFCNYLDGRRYLFRYDLTAGKLTQVTREHTFNGRWLGEGGGMAYVGNPGNTSYLAIRPGGTLTGTNLFASGSVRSFNAAPDGTKIYAIAALGAEPEGIWEYDIASTQLRAAVPAMRQGFSASRIIVPTSSTAPVKGRTPVTYFILQPANLDYSKRYPLVIDGPQSSRWQAHSQFLANVGVYYVAVNRRGLSSSDDLTGAADDMLAVYVKLIKNRNVDPHRIFLAGFSDSTDLVTELVQREPELWRGILLNSPVAVPQLASQSAAFPAVFVSIGERDSPQLLKMVRHLGEQACEKRIPVTIIYHAEAGHLFTRTESNMERYDEIARFVLRQR